MRILEPAYAALARREKGGEWRNSRAKALRAFRKFRKAAENK